MKDCSCRCSPCCCCPLRTGTLFIATLGTVTSVIYLALGIIYYEGPIDTATTDQSVQPDLIEIKEFNRERSIRFLIIATIGLTFSLFLLIGAYLKSPKLVKGWFYCYLVYFGLEIILHLILALLYYLLHVLVVVDYDFGIETLIRIIVQSYVLCVVNSFRKELDSSEVPATSAENGELPAAPHSPVIMTQICKEEKV